MGDIPAKSNMVSCKFSSPRLTQCTANFGTVAANTSFNVALQINGMQTGAFVNPDSNYFAAPQQLNGQGQIIGHSHFVIEKINSLQDTTVTNPGVFAFFQGLNAPAVNNQLTATVAKGLPEGVYRASTINTAANHQPVLVPVAQHGSLDDWIYVSIPGVHSPPPARPSPPQPVSSPPAQPRPPQPVTSPPARPRPPQPVTSPPAQPRPLLTRKRLPLALRTTTTVAVVRHGASQGFRTSKAEQN
ncbi:hypothetical protein JB92DRAFT_2936129 [Gautieria morchelliformis]|nr:hypothetical protein JB92DRAFT_2936129 [Gautieria morchelliformis]